MAQRGKKRPFPGDTDDSADRKRHLDKIYEQITPKEDDKNDSKALVDAILKDMLKSIGKQDGGDIYKKYYVDAESHPVREKTGKANEFDVDIPMSIKPKNVERYGYVYYQLREVKHSAVQKATSTSSMTKEHELEETTRKNDIPQGYCVVEVKNLELREASKRKIHVLPHKFEHRVLHSFVNISQRTDSCIDLLPYDVKSDLLDKLSNYSSKHPLVSLSRSSHGPALTLTIKPQGDVEHSISLDITPTIEYSIETSQFGWPRPETIQAFGKPLVEDTIAKAPILSRKKTCFWRYLSPEWNGNFSLGWTMTLSALDWCPESVLEYSAYTYRDITAYTNKCAFWLQKICLQNVEKYIEDCKRWTGELPGISYIVKLLWSCEYHADDRYYWKYANRDICLINTMGLFEDALISHELEDYFNKELDLLDGMHPNVFNRLADFTASKRFELQQMKELT